MSRAALDAVAFDIGGVLLEWDPRHLYRKLLPPAKMERFLATVCTPEWNLAQDGGRSFAAGVAELVACYPDQAELIRAYDERWTEMVSGEVDGSVDVLRELRDRGIRTYAVTNFSADKWAIAEGRWDFLSLLDGAVVSGIEQTLKPGRQIFEILLDRYGLAADRTFFVDDRPENVAGARAAGLRAEVFRSAGELRGQLVALGALPATA